MFHHPSRDPPQGQQGTPQVQSLVPSATISETLLYMGIVEYTTLSQFNSSDPNSTSRRLHCLKVPATAITESLKFIREDINKIKQYICIITKF